MGYYWYSANIIVKKNDGSSADYTISKDGQREVPQGTGFSVYVNFYSSESYTREGYNFVGYKLDDAGSMKYPGDSVNFYFTSSGTQNQYWYCQWQLKTYTISYNANGGAGAPGSQTKTHGQALTLSSTVPTRTNYIFQGWATSPSGAVQYQPGGSFTTNATTILYAVWKQAAATLNTVSNTEIGGSGTATWTIINSAHTYKLSIGFLNAPVVEVTSAANTSSCSFTIPNTWLPTFANAASATVTATLYTYNGGTLVGSTQKTFTVSVPASVKPSISAFTATSHSANATAEGWNIAVQGYSYLTLAVTADPGSGSSIASIAFSGHGIQQSSTSATGNTAILTESGTLIYTVIVTDGRGRSATTTVNVTCYEYANPTISSLTAVRCYSDGTASDTEGNYIKAFPTFAFSSVNGNNSLSVNKIEYKQQDTSTWTVGVQSVTSGQWTSAFGPADITKSFNVRFTITDALSNTYALEIIVQSVVGYGFGLKNDRFRLGGPVRKPGFECDWDAEFNGVVDILQRRCFTTLSSAGWYRVMQTKDVAGTIINFYIGRPWDSNPAETHKISFHIVGSGKSAFLDETSDTNTLCVDKIRVTYGGGLMYFDVHYNASSANEVLVYFDVYGKGQANGTSIAMGLESVADAPVGETVLTTYEFVGNTDYYESSVVDGVNHDIYRSGDIVTVSIRSSGGKVLTANTYVTVWTIPQGFRPKFTVYGVADNLGGNRLIGYNVAPDGSINLYANGSNTSYFAFTATYKC